MSDASSQGLSPALAHAAGLARLGWCSVTEPIQPQPRRVALVTSGFQLGGGVPNMTRWLRAGLESNGGYAVDIFDLATSGRDVASRRVLRPHSWFRSTLKQPLDANDETQHWGANAVEVEVMRYRPRVELTRALRAYDLIQVVSGGPALAAAVAQSGVPLILLVATRVGWERESQRPSDRIVTRAWRRLMTAMTSRVEVSSLIRVDAVLVLNDRMLAYVRSLGQRHALKAPPGVDTERFTPRQGGWRSDGYLLSVCRLGDARKGLDRMVLAYWHMVRADPKVPRLLLAGKGELHQSAADLIRRLGLQPRVEVQMDVDAGKLACLYQGASVYLQSSYEEGLGISVLEAMATGLPVVATDTAGSRESVIDAETGWLVPQTPADQVAPAMAERSLLVLHQVGDVMSVRARQRCVTHFSQDVTLARVRDIYDTLLGPARA